MVKLRISDTKLQPLSGELFNCLTNLATLEIKTAKFVSQNETFYLDENLFHKAENLKELNIGYNDWNESNLSIDSRIFNQLKNFESLNLGFCETNLNVNELQEFSRLKKLLLDGPPGKKLMSIDSKVFQKMKNLQVLTLGSYIELTPLDTLHLPNLIELDLDQNSFKTKSLVELLKPLKNLKKLSMNGCELKDLSFLKKISLPYIEELGLNRCQASIKDPSLFSNFQKLKKLDLWRVDVRNSDLNFLGLSDLRCLILSETGLSTIDSEMFKTLKNLERLDLDYNNIASLDDNVFSELTNLKSLSIKDNKLTSIKVEWLKNLKHLEKLEIGGNKNSF